MEIWKEIIYAKDYEVSSLGNVRNKITGKLLNGSYTGNRNGIYRYKSHGLMVNGNRIFNMTHRIVAMHFIENKNNYPFVNHIDENTFNNSANNLEWTTNQLNIRHSNKRKINQLTLDGKLIKTWDALFLIKDNGFNISKISEVLNKKKYRKTANGYKWEYVQEDNGDSENTES